MKQHLCLLISFLFLSLLLTGCGNTSADSTLPSTSTPSTSPSTSPSESQTTFPSDPTTNTTQPTDPSHTHTWTDWETVSEATCSAPGAKSRSCSCGEAETESIPQLDHTEVIDTAVESTCSQTGLTEGKHCSVCGQVIIAQEVTSTKAHTFGDWTVTQESSCSVPGTQIRTCSCGATESEALALLPHTEVVDANVEPTCTESGLTSGKHCSVCGAITVSQSVIPATGHSYQNGVCACGVLECGGTLIQSANLPLTSFIWTNGEILCGGIDGGYYMYTVEGEYLAGPFDSVQCPNPDGYVIAWNFHWEIIDTVFDEDYYEYIDIEHEVTYAYLIDPNGNVIYETVGEWTDDYWTRTYAGEYLAFCNEDRIITVSWNPYYAPTMGNDCTVHIRDMQGNLIADIEEVREYSNIINGKMIVSGYGYVAVYDKDGNVLSYVDALEEYEDYFFWPEQIGDGHHKGYFTDGYAMIDYSYFTFLIHENGGKNYIIDKYCLYSLGNFGTLVFSKVYDTGGTLSEHYYLIDVSKCALDDSGMVIPTLDAAVSAEPLVLGDFLNFFGQEEMYMVVGTLDGRFGYMSKDGVIHRTYEDVTGFYGGYAMVQENGEIYVIDENFNRVSEIISGFDSISSSGEGVFILRKDGIPYVYIFTP